MIALTQDSYTSVMNSRTASSVCGLAGLFGIVAVLLDEEEVDALSSEDGGVVVVNGANGGNTCGFWTTDGFGGAVLGGCGRCRSRNLTPVGVRKHDTCAEA